MLSRITSSWVFSTSKDRDTIISLGNLFPARDHPHSRKLHVVFIRRYRDSIEESVSDWFSSCSVWIGSTGRTLWGTYLQLCSLWGYPTNYPRKPNCWQQPAVHTNQELLHSKVRLYPNQVCSMGQPSLSQTLPNSSNLQDSDHKLWREQQLISPLRLVWHLNRKQLSWTI